MSVINFINQLAIIFGYLCLVELLILSIVFGLLKAINIIEQHQDRYRYKHRFDKPPIAKCYCIDCKYYNYITTLCSKKPNNIYSYDNWFCKDAEPKGTNQ